MNEIFIERFRAQGSVKDGKIQVKTLEEGESIDVDKEYAAVIEENKDAKKVVFNTRVSNENLPYPDKSFDLYISSLSMMIVPNHHNQLSEAYRVLEDGATAGFTVWGRPENSTFFTFLPKVLKEAGVEMEQPGRSNFHLGVDKAALVSDAKKAGFKSVKAYYTQINPNLGSAEQLFKFYVGGPAMVPVYSKMSDEEKKNLEDTFNRLYEEDFGPESEEGTTWENLVLLATK